MRAWVKNVMQKRRLSKILPCGTMSTYYIELLASKDPGTWVPRRNVQFIIITDSPTTG